MNASLVVSLTDADAHGIEWRPVDRCPLCSATASGARLIPDRNYVFGDERVAYPTGGISLASCNNCGLRYKTMVPAPHSITSVMERQAGKKWMEPYDYGEEIGELKRIVDDRPTDLLDIGCGNGGLLAAWARHSQGRRSALDIVQHPGCAEHIDGEFIRGLIDGDRLAWSRKPYDVVTMFDVLEHLYAPQTAFANLHDLVTSGGSVVIETGNVESPWPVRDGAERWWYVRLFEHHIFWSRRPLEYIAKQFGFRLLIWRDVRHKARAVASLPSKLNDIAQVGLYRLAPNIYPSIAPLFGKYWTQPWSPFTKDHFRVVLRKP
jgi:SAM-dependent methyltransferase